MFADFNLTQWWKGLQRTDPCMAFLVMFGVAAVCIVMIGIGTIRNK